MVNHYFKAGLVLGRFQPFHKGHKLLVDSALDSCDIVVVVIGSAQLGDTPNNPLYWGERYNIISNAYKNEIAEGRLHILPVNDRTNYSNDSSFGEYIDAQIENALGIHIDCVIEGKEEVRKDWYKSLPLKGTIQVDRDGLDVSATKIREAILTDNFGYLYANDVEEARDYYYRIKKVLEHYAE